MHFLTYVVSVFVMLHVSIIVLLQVSIFCSVTDLHVYSVTRLHLSSVTCLYVCSVTCLHLCSVTDLHVYSFTGLAAVPPLGPYVISKHAFEAFSNLLRKEMRKWDVHVVTIRPMGFDTGRSVMTVLAVR